MVKTNYLDDNNIIVDFSTWESYQKTKFDNWKNYTEQEWKDIIIMEKEKEMEKEQKQIFPFPIK